MNRTADWVFGALASIGLAAATLMFGLTLVPAMADAQVKQGTLVPWMLIWSFIWLAVLAGIILASFLVITGLRGNSE